MRVLLAYFFIRLQENNLDDVSLNDMLNLRGVCEQIDCR